MLSATPTKFRSRYTGAEVDSLLTSISNKIDTSYIVNNFDGGTGLVASAELAKTLYLNDQRFEDPNYIQDLILSIPNAVIYTTADQDKLNRLAGAFQGSFPNAATRNQSVNTGSFKGGELTFLINDGNGQQELSYWDSGALTWQKSQLIPSDNTIPATYPSGGDNVVMIMDLAKYEAAKYMVKCRNGTDIMIFEILLCTNGVDTFWTSQGYIGNNLTIGKMVNCSLTATELRITMNLALNTTVTFVRLSEV